MIVRLIVIGVAGFMSFAALACGDIDDGISVADDSDIMLADNRRKERRDDRHDDRDDKQDCRQEEGRVGDDKRECKQEKRDGDDEGAEPEVEAEPEALV